MQNMDQKKWFVYLGDHHEGPFSVDEVLQKENSGVIGRGSFVWCDGMPDWKPMQEVDELAPRSPPETPSANAPRLSVVSDAPVLEPAPSLESAEPSAVLMETPTMESPVMETPVFEPTLTEVTSPSQPHQEPVRIVAQNQKQAPSPSVPNPTRTKNQTVSAQVVGKSDGRSRFFKLFLFLLLTLGLAGAYVQGYLNPVIQIARDLAGPSFMEVLYKIPYVDRWLSPIPPIQDADEADVITLKNAAKSGQEESPLEVGLGLSRSDVFAPSFYVSSRLPEGTRFEVYVVGIRGTLLNQLEFQGKYEAIIGPNRLGKTPSITQPDGKPIPRGEYQVTVVESLDQPDGVRDILSQVGGAQGRVPEFVPQNRKLLATNRYFLAGAKDASYVTRLNAFHEKIREKSAAEIAELKQITMTLIGQFNASNTTFFDLRKRAARNRNQAIAQWKAFDTKWKSMDQQLGATIDRWTPDMIKSERFHTQLFTLAVEAASALRGMHTLHGDYFSRKVNAKEYDIQQAETVSRAQLALSNLKARIQTIENAPPQPSGLPALSE